MAIFEGRREPLIELASDAHPDSHVESWADDTWSSGFAYTGRRVSGHLGTTGDGSDLRSASALLLNLDELSWHQPVTLEADGWHITIALTSADHLSDLRDRGGYGITHVAEIHRAGASFTSEELGTVLGHLFHFLAFVNGRLAGVALPTGYDADGNVRSTTWSITATDPYRSSINWFDRTLAAELPGLFKSWIARVADPFWELVLRRSTRLISAANHPNPLDVAVTTAATGIELLAWAVLSVEKGWVVSDSGDLTAGGLARLLLGWAGLPFEIPAELVHLQREAKQRRMDAPSALAWVRNRLVHPPKRPSDGWPTSDVITDAWRLSMEQLELVVLRLLDYQGSYGHRRHLDGRWLGSTSPVPWAEPTPSPPAESAES